MASPFLGQIEIFAFDFPPKQWVPCNGQLLPINQYTALFALLGTTYGGNGTNNFALPDLRGRVAVGVGTDYQQVVWSKGQVGGEESLALSTSQIPAHTHTLRASSGAAGTGNTDIPGGTVGLGETQGHDKDKKPLAVPTYVVDPAPAAVLGSSAVSQPLSGSGLPHENRMPLLAINFCISMAGVFPSRN